MGLAVGSFRFWVLLVISVYFGFTLYWAFVGTRALIQYTSDAYVYQELSKGPSWWLILYYLSEGVAGMAGSLFRAGAGFFAFVSAFLYMRKNDEALPRIRRTVSVALLLEAGYILWFIPYAVAAIAYVATGGSLYYFDHTPELIILFVTAIPALASVLTLPPLLLRLRYTVARAASSTETLKWVCLTIVAYLLVPFWLAYSLAWVANMVPYWRAQEQFGLTFLLNPVNFASFTVTVFGLLIIAASSLKLTLPAIRKQTALLSTRHLAAVATAFGAYFAFNLIYYYTTGGYAAHPNVWYEVIGPLHNVNLWCITFLILGIALLLNSKRSKNDAATNESADVSRLS
jgi:hypothetical protein